MALVVSDLSGSSSSVFKWNARKGKICDVQFDFADETKVYSLEEDKKMLRLWGTSIDTPLRKIHFEDYPPPPLYPTLTESYWWFRTRRIPHPAIGRNKLFGFVFTDKYILISSVEGKVLYEVK